MTATINELYTFVEEHFPRFAKQDSFDGNFMVSRENLVEVYELPGDHPIAFDFTNTTESKGGYYAVDTARLEIDVYAVGEGEAKWGAYLFSINGYPAVEFLTAWTNR